MRYQNALILRIKSLACKLKVLQARTGMHVNTQKASTAFFPSDMPGAVLARLNTTQAINCLSFCLVSWQGQTLKLCLLLIAAYLFVQRTRRMLCLPACILLI
jgi:hypothetical protein